MSNCVQMCPIVSNFECKKGVEASNLGAKVQGECKAKGRSANCKASKKLHYGKIKLLS